MPDRSVVLPDLVAADGDRPTFDDAAHSHSVNDNTRAGPDLLDERQFGSGAARGDAHV